MAYETSRNNLLAIIRILGFVIVGFMLFTGYLLMTWKSSNQNNFIDIPAYTLGGKNETLELNVMNKSTVYSFASMVFQKLNHWSYDGEKEYENNIRENENMLTPAYMAFLRRDMERRKGNKVSSELRKRTRTMIPIATGWDEDRVKVVSTKDGKPSAWVVFLDVELIEKIKGETIKQLYLRYPLRVALYETNRDENPWLLALDGYQSEPERLSKDMETK